MPGFSSFISSLSDCSVDPCACRPWEAQLVWLVRTWLLDQNGWRHVEYGFYLGNRWFGLQNLQTWRPTSTDLNPYSLRVPPTDRHMQLGIYCKWFGMSVHISYMSCMRAPYKRPRCIPTNDESPAKTFFTYSDGSHVFFLSQVYTYSHCVWSRFSHGNWMELGTSQDAIKIHQMFGSFGSLYRLYREAIPRNDSNSWREMDRERLARMLSGSMGVVPLTPCEAKWSKRILQGAI